MPDNRKRNGPKPGNQCQALLENGERCKKMQKVQIEVLGDGIMVRANVCSFCGDGKVKAVGR